MQRFLLGALPHCKHQHSRGRLGGIWEEGKKGAMGMLPHLSGEAKKKKEEADGNGFDMRSACTAWLKKQKGFSSPFSSSVSLPPR